MLLRVVTCVLNSAAIILVELNNFPFVLVKVFVGLFENIVKNPVK